MRRAGPMGNKVLVIGGELPVSERPVLQRNSAQRSPSLNEMRGLAGKSGLREKGVAT